MALALGQYPNATSEPPQSAGTKANVSGYKLENDIEEALRQTGFTVLTYRDWNADPSKYSGTSRIALLDAPYRSIYGHDGRIEFLLMLNERRILVEAKRMSTSGSYDEKLPYVFMNALENMPENEFLLVMEGEGWRAGARNWIIRQAADTEGFEVIRSETFRNWLQFTLSSE